LDDDVGGLVGGGGAGAEEEPWEAMAVPAVPESDPDGDGCVVEAGPMVFAPSGADLMTPMGQIVDGGAWIPEVAGASEVEPGPPAFDAESAPPHAVVRSTTAPRIQGFRRAMASHLRLCRSG
jgi:hypothetical protein